MHWRYFDDHAAAYIRIAAISVAAYDYIITLPAEWRFYKGQRGWRLSAGCTLFILIRYISIVTMLVSTVGYFARFSPATCQRYFLVSPIFKVVQTMVSQIILGIRTLNISRREPWVMWTLLILFTVVTAMEWFTNLYDRTYVQNEVSHTSGSRTLMSEDPPRSTYHFQRHNCIGGDNLRHMSVWLYYVMAMIYDIVTLGISAFYLLRVKPPSGRMSQLVKLMLYDGIGYFVLLTAANILNLILYRTSDKFTQSSGACMAYAVTWIMSQRILIHLRDAAENHNRTSATHVISRPLQSARDISHAMRSQFETKDWLDEELGITPSDRSLSDLEHGFTDVLDVQVQIEESVTVEYVQDLYERESYRTPQAMWNRTPR
ncbi:hypothetical protein AcW1_001740 [Taiwanofungus camphoratus]|nr:hypothetical protein AcV7_001594 [Antrodia cinnamomea]KAI0945542.1 hypothetical protein AcW1_001740 [Antrodia cinnamomea]